MVNATLLYKISPAPTSAASLTFTVNVLTDPGDGICDAVECTLREAILTANAQPGVDTVRFAHGLSGTLLLNGTQLPPIAGDVLILGPGSDQLTISGENRSRVLEIGLTGGDAYSVTVRGLTISAGNAPGVIQVSTGAGICIYEGSRLLLEDSVLRNHTSAGYGAAITNSGTLFIRRSIIEGSKSDLGGAGISNFGLLSIEQSTVSANQSRGDGAGIRNRGVMTISNSTLTGNISSNNGGGIYNGGVMAIMNSTIVFNHANSDGNDSGQGGGIYQSGDSAQMTLGNTILAKNLRNGSADNLAQDAVLPGVVTSLGFNLSDSALVVPSGPGDLTEVNPRLGPLQSNGGETPSHAPTAGSPALDAGKDFGNSGRDQTGNARPVDLPVLANPSGGDGSDIGAIEAQSQPASSMLHKFLPAVLGE